MNTRILLTTFLFLTYFSSMAQELTGNQLLDKAIAYHDPDGAWKTFQGKLFITMQTPDRSDRISEVSMDFPQNFFNLKATRDEISTQQTVDKGKCHSALNGNSTISQEDQKKYRLDCERAHTMKNYYTYLYGLPMKLKDNGTIIDPKVQVKKFKGKEYLVLKASYTKDVGNDVWYFYFDPDTYAMEVYQFYHDESKNDGEYILLSEQEEISGIKMPKIRAWYYNKNDQYLGTDVLTKTSSLK